MYNYFRDTFIDENVLNVLEMYLSKEIKTGNNRGGGGLRSLKNTYLLSREACYFLCLNCDPNKKPMAAIAQEYFVQSAITLETLQKRIGITSTISLRENCKESDKLLNSILFRYGGLNSSTLAMMKSSFDEALFGKPTSELKDMLGIPVKDSLIDHYNSKFLLLVKYSANCYIANTIHAFVEESPNPVLDYSLIERRGIRVCEHVREDFIEMFKLAPEEFLVKEKVSNIEELEKKYDYDIKIIAKHYNKLYRMTKSDIENM